MRYLLRSDFQETSGIRKHRRQDTIQKTETGAKLKSFSPIMTPLTMFCTPAVLAGWLSDKVFRGNRFVPVLISGLLCLLSLGAFLFTAGGYSLNIIYVSVFSLAIGVVYCTVAGLMALDIVPRKATAR